MTPDRPLVCTRPPGWLGADASDAFAQMRAWAQHAEALGFDGLFVGDRMLSRATTSGGVVYGSSMLEATTTLAALAASTERLLLGPLIMVFPYRHPLQVAKVVATLDVISGGRVVLGAGVGWNPPEFAALGVPTAGRGERFEEQLALVRRPWSGDAVTHAGEGWAFENAQIAPTPVQAGGPPVWLASFSPGSALDWSEDVPPNAAARAGAGGPPRRRMGAAGVLGLGQAAPGRPGPGARLGAGPRQRGDRRPWAPGHRLRVLRLVLRARWIALGRALPARAVGLLLRKLGGRAAYVHDRDGRRGRREDPRALRRHRSRRRLRAHAAGRRA